jgi:predicted metal-dependent hydrolase
MVHVTNYPDAYIRYLEYYHGARDYFECHEVLEEYWKEHPESPLRLAWIGLIQLAVAMYHHRRGNINGAVKMLSSAILLLDDRSMQQLGIEAYSLKTLLKERLSELELFPEKVFKDIDIPLVDPALKERITIVRTDDMIIDPYIMNKHTLRDRTEVVAARQAEWIKRRKPV